MLSLPRRSLAALALLGSSLLSARGAEVAVDPGFDERVGLLFRPALAEQIAFAPDGKHLAYTRHRGSNLYIEILDVDSGAVSANILADGPKDLAFSREKQPGQLRFLRWATSNRLVFAPTVYSIPPAPGQRYPTLVAPILAVDADGQNPKEIVDSRDYAVSMDNLVETPTETSATTPSFARSRAPVPLGFLAGDRKMLLMEVAGFRPTPVEGQDAASALPLSAVQSAPTDLFRVDTLTGKAKQLGAEGPFNTYTYDWQGRYRLAYSVAQNATDEVFTYRAADGKGGWRALPQVVKAWDARLFRTTAENYFGERALPIGFDFDPDILYVASNAKRDTFAVHAVNLKSGVVTPIEAEGLRVDFGPAPAGLPSPLLVFDEHKQQLVGVRAPNARRTTLWRDPELEAFQRAMETNFPRGSVVVLDWSADRQRFLVRVTSGMEPGRTYLYQRAEKRLREIARSAPWLEENMLHETRAFNVALENGTRINGYVTAPRKPRLAVPPVIVCFAPQFPAVPHAEFDPEAHVLADLGFIVLRINQRGTTGFGQQHLNAIAGGLDTAAVADAKAVIDWLASRTKIDRKRIVAYGHDFAGYLAVRAAQLAPDMFRCAVAFDAPLDPEAWLPPEAAIDGERLNVRQRALRAFFLRAAPHPHEVSVLHKPETLTRAVLLVVEPTRNEAVDAANSRLRGKGREVETIEVGRDFALGLGGARARVYAQMQEFFNLNLYNYDVKIGETKEVK